MRYKISYEKPNSQYIPIQAEFDVTEDNYVELQFPSWRPGRYERGDFVKNVHSFEVHNDQNKIIKSFKVAKDVWKVDCSSTKSIKVYYKYYAAELNAGSTYMDDLQLYVNPVNCLIYIKTQQNKACELSLEIPDNFEIACGQSFSDNCAKFKDYHELVDSPFIASAGMKHLKFNCKGIDFHMWFQGEVKLDEDRLLKDFQRYTTSQIEKFQKFPVEEYHYLFQIQAVQAYHGVEHQTSTVISLGPTYDLMGSLYDELLGVSSHELYHTWNVKALRPEEMYPYDYSKENYSRQGYVTEGVTTYMGDLFLVESGVKDWKWYKKELEKLLQRHFDNFGRFNYSVAQSSFDTWLDGYLAGAPNRKVSIYNEGALLSLIIDAKIRTNSGNKTSLHDAMRDLYENFSLKNKGYTERDFQGTIEKYADENLSDFFANYYYGVHSFKTVLTAAFEQLGLSLKMEKNPSYAANILGIKHSNNSQNKTVINAIYPGSSADLAEIMLNDEILTVNGFKVNKDLDKWVEYFQHDQIEMTLSRKGRIINVVCPHTNKSYYPIYKIEKAIAPSNLQKRLFESWCGNDWDQL
jgi:predicted metalloprotease with PDZ domain